MHLDRQRQQPFSIPFEELTHGENRQQELAVIKHIDGKVRKLYPGHYGDVEGVGKGASLGAKRVEVLYFCTSFSYTDEVKDGMSGVTQPAEPDEVLNQPIETLDLPTRAQSCLISLGCKHIADVVRVPGTKIATTPHLGKISANDI